MRECGKVAFFLLEIPSLEQCGAESFANSQVKDATLYRELSEPAIVTEAAMETRRDESQEGRIRQDRQSHWGENGRARNGATAGRTGSHPATMTPGSRTIATTANSRRHILSLAETLRTHGSLPTPPSKLTDRPGTDGPQKRAGKDTLLEAVP